MIDVAETNENKASVLFVSL